MELNAIGEAFFRFPFPGLPKRISVRAVPPPRPRHVHIERRVGTRQLPLRPAPDPGKTRCRAGSFLSPPTSSALLHLSNLNHIPLLFIACGISTSSSAFPFPFLSSPLLLHPSYFLSLSKFPSAPDLFRRVFVLSFYLVPRIQTCYALKPSFLHLPVVQLARHHVIIVRVHLHHHQSR